MLQQTQVKTVIPYYERWMRALPDMRTLARADDGLLHKLWEGLGYYTRVRNLRRAAQQIVERHGGRFPRECEAMLALPGVGRYTAGAICSLAFHQPTPIVDGNVARVLSRVFGLRADPGSPAAALRLWSLAEALVRRAADTGEKAACAALNSALMELGALCCTPRVPRCAECPVRSSCAAARAGNPERFPARPKRPVVTARREVAFLVRRSNRVLARQRPPGVVNAGLWELPTCEVSSGENPTPPGRLLGLIRHSITRYRITLEAREVSFAELPAVARRPDDRWLTLGELEDLAFTSAHRRLVRRFAVPGG